MRAGSMRAHAVAGAWDASRPGSHVAMSRATILPTHAALTPSSSSGATTEAPVGEDTFTQHLRELRCTRANQHHAPVPPTTTVAPTTASATIAPSDVSSPRSPPLATLEQCTTSRCEGLLGSFASLGIDSDRDIAALDPTLLLNTLRCVSKADQAAPVAFTITPIVPTPIEVAPITAPSGFKLDLLPNMEEEKPCVPEWWETGSIQLQPQVCPPHTMLALLKQHWSYLGSMVPSHDLVRVEDWSAGSLTWAAQRKAQIHALLTVAHHRTAERSALSVPLWTPSWGPPADPRLVLVSSTSSMHDSTTRYTLKLIYGKQVFHLTLSNDRSSSPRTSLFNVERSGRRVSHKGGASSQSQSLEGSSTGRFERVMSKCFNNLQRPSHPLDSYHPETTSASEQGTSFL